MLNHYHLPSRIEADPISSGGNRVLLMSDSKEIQRLDGLVVEEAKPKLKRPQLFRVILINDDYTPMEFVVMVLQQFFRLAHDDAVQIMLNVHTKGSGVCGVYPSEIAQTKVREVMNFAKENEHPLQCTMEPE